MQFSLKKFVFKLELAFFQGLKRLLPLIAFLGVVIATPFSLLWKTIRPIAIISYKSKIVFSERLKNFFHAQHKLLSIVTHRFSIHIFVIVLTFGVVLVNVFQAQEVRAEDFAQGSLVSKIFSKNQETVVTADTLIPKNSNYINAAVALRAVPHIGDVGLMESNTVTVAGNGTALVKSNALGNGPVNDNTIQQYLVQPGDTASTIAEQFDISTQTVLWSNGLSDASLIRPGDTLYILPTSGVAHTIESGETLVSIASKFGSSVDDIVNFNHLLNASDVPAGVEIIIPGGKKPEPPAPVQTSRPQLASLKQVFVGGSSTPPPNASVNFSTKFQWPTTTRRISSGYGWRAFDGFHPGIDIDGHTGDAIYAAEAGSVQIAGWNGAYGISVLIDHGNGVRTRYGHMSKTYVSVGQSVTRGQTIGAEGATGNAYGDHLHFECIVNGRQLNPFGNCF